MNSIYLKTCIVDDSKLARDELIRLLDGNPYLDICSQAATLHEAYNILETNSPDLLFLDIDLPDGNGFEVLNKTQINTLVIFTTAHIDFAVQAFDENAVDYLLKPINEERLDQAIQRATLLKNKYLHVSNKPKLGKDDTVFVRDGEKCQLIKVKDIRYFETYGNYCYIYFGNEKVILNKTLNYLTKRLDSNAFFRPNRQHIININYIKDIYLWNDESYRVELTCSKEIDISRRKSKQLSQMLSF